MIYLAFSGPNGDLGGFKSNAIFGEKKDTTDPNQYMYYLTVENAGGLQYLNHNKSCNGKVGSNTESTCTKSNISPIVLSNNKVSTQLTSIHNWPGAEDRISAMLLVTPGNRVSAGTVYLTVPLAKNATGEVMKPFKIDPNSKIKVGANYVYAPALSYCNDKTAEWCTGCCPQTR